MIEAAARQVKEEELEEALKMASIEISKLEEFQKNIVKEIGKEKRVIAKEIISAESVTLFNENILPKIEAAIFSGAGKKEIDTLHTVWNNLIKEKFAVNKEGITIRTNFEMEDDLFDDTENKILHVKAVKENKRADG